MGNARIDQVFAPFLAHGAKSYGEDVTQYAHAVQCAQLARAQQTPPSLIAAALLHDIGHLLDNAGATAAAGVDAAHEDIGARFLSSYFGPDVTEPIRLHVRAKRYLCAIEPRYFAGLSAASRQSLILQGGPFDIEQLDQFEREPFFAEALALRRWDEAAKLRDWVVPPMQSYRALLTELLLPQP